MTDLVVTVPKGMWLDWIREGDVAGDPASSLEWGFHLGGGRPPISPGERLYIVAWGRLRGYAPVTRVERTGRGWCIVRKGGAVACTLDQEIVGFRGWRKRWWENEDERSFEGWEVAGLPDTVRAQVEAHRRERRLVPCKCGKQPKVYDKSGEAVLLCKDCMEFVGPDLPGLLPMLWNHFQHRAASQAFVDSVR